MARTPEQQAAALADVQRMFDGDKAPPAAEPTPEAKPAEVVKTDPATDPNAAAPVVPAEEVVPPKDEPAEKGRVPYKRFAEVNAEAKAAKAERDALKAERDALVAAAAEKKPETKGKHWLLDDLLDGPDEPETPAAAKPELSAYEERLARIEAREAQAELNEVLANAAKDYPTVPQHVFLAGLAAGKEVEDIVGEWDPAFEHIGQLYVKQHGYQKAAPAEAVKPKPETMPRLGGAPAPLTPEATKNKYAPGTPQHRAAAIEWMKRNGF